MARPKEFDANQALVKAMDLFWSYGYAHTSLQDLLSHMEIGRASFYNTFGDKRQLFLMVLDRYLATLEDSILATLTNAPSGIAGVRAVLEWVVNEIIDDSKQKGCFMINSAIELSPYDDEIAGKIDHTMHRMEQALMNTLQRAEAEGEIKAGQNLQALASTVMNTIRGMRVMARQSVQPEMLWNIVEVTVSIVK